MKAQEVRNPVDRRMAESLAKDRQVQAMQQAMQGQGGIPVGHSWRRPCA